MAAYQVPQFLDSGDKILGPLNLRQFFYVLVTFLICVVIFTVTSSILPTLGTYAVVPAIPFALFGLYLAMGKYNSRDSEIYIVKWFTSLFKEKKMIYVRQPYLDDLNKKAVEWSAPQIETRWSKSIAELTEDEEDVYSSFRKDQAEKKAIMIKELGGYIDSGLYNALSEVKKRELQINTKQEAVKQMKYLKQKVKQGDTIVNLNYSNNFYKSNNSQKVLKKNILNQNFLN